MKLKISVYLFVLSCLCQCISLHAENLGWNFTAGISIKQLSLDVYLSGDTDPQGTLVEDVEFVPEIGVEGGIRYFADSQFGYKYVVNFGGFHMDKQEVDLEDVDLNTSAKGYYLYAMPVAVYDFLKARDNQSLLLGLGIGVGYLNVSGDIIFTEATPQTRHSFDFSEFNLSYGLFFEYVVDSWSYSLNAYSPEADDGGYEYNLFDIGMTVRKRFSF